MTDRVAPFDQLSVLRSDLEQDFQLSPDERKRKKQNRIDEILEMLIIAYMFGNESGNAMLYGDNGIQTTDLERPIPIQTDSMNEAIFRKVADKNWEQRVSEYMDSETGTVDEIIRVVDTDMNRVYNDAILDVGERADGDVMKTWQTMLDDRVRDTHDYLENTSVPVDRRFYTFDGDSARYPGDFTLPQNNVGCRCRISLSR